MSKKCNVETATPLLADLTDGTLQRHGHAGTAEDLRRPPAATSGAIPSTWRSPVALGEVDGMAPGGAMGHERSSTTLDLYTRRTDDPTRILRVLEGDDEEDEDGLGWCLCAGVMPF